MSKSNINKSITVKASAECIADVRCFAEETLNNVKMDSRIVKENALVLEEIFVKACSFAENKDSEITVSVKRRIKSIYIYVEYDGKRFEFDECGTGQKDIGATILSRYEEKLGIKYRREHNTISLLILNQYPKMFVYYSAATILGLTVGLLTKEVLSTSMQATVYSHCLDWELSFLNVIMMICTPVTFFSMVTNVTDIFVLADRSLNIKKLLFKIILTSVFYLFVGYLITCILDGVLPVILHTPTASAGIDIFSLSADSIPGDIFSAFSLLSPYPITILAVILSLAVINVNRGFNEAKSLIDTVNNIFQSALDIVYCLMPIALFLAFVDVGLTCSYREIFEIARDIVICYLCAFIAIAIYLIRVAVNGINPFKFLRDCFPALLVNYKINSLCTAVPYNIRFCNQTFGIKMQKLDIEVPLMSKLNLDGNCIMLMITAIGITYAYGVIPTGSQLIGLALLILVLSISAPDRSGSLLVGLVVCVSCFGLLKDVACTIIYIEAFLGGVLAVINTMGNFVLVAIEAKKKGELKY